MAGFKSEEHKEAYRAIRAKYDPVLIEVNRQWAEAVNPINVQTRAELNAEHERHMADVREINGRRFAALRPIEAPFKERVWELRLEMDRELAAIDKAFNQPSGVS